MTQTTPGPASGLALSTVYASAQAREADWLLDRMQATGLLALELEYRLTGPLVTGIKASLRPRGLRVVSVHNFCPLPAGLPRDQASGDLFNLSSFDREERGLALGHTLTTLELASELEAPAVVLHLGAVEGARDREVTKQASRQGEMTSELRANLARRAAEAPQALDAVSFSLERLLERALPLGVSLGLENRYHAFQVPDLAETRLLLERFAGAPLGYWHDTGHAHNREKAGLESGDQWLEELGGHLLGCHLHDAQGPDDHRAPGSGDINWPELMPRLAPAPHKVLEIKPGPSPSEVAQAAAMLAGLLAGL